MVTLFKWICSKLLFTVPTMLRHCSIAGKKLAASSELEISFGSTNYLRGQDHGKVKSNESFLRACRDSSKFDFYRKKQSVFRIQWGVQD